MDRLIAPNSVPLSSADTAPVSGTPQYATDGNPAAGIPATQWPAYQYNAIQEELMAILAAAGITPDRTQLGQIAEAIPLLCSGRVLGRATYDVGPGGAAQAFNAAVPAGARKVRIRAIGGGASGAGSLATGSAVCSVCSGGGTGAWIDGFVMDCSELEAITGTVGSGGSASSGAGNNGGSTTITGGAAWQIVLQGGNGGAVKQVSSGVGSFDVAAQGNGGSTITITGTPLTYGNQSAGVPGLVGLILNGGLVSGQGASCPFGGGGPNTNVGNGGNASGNGAGGGGAAAPPSSATVTGGLGSGGYVELTFFS